MKYDIDDYSTWTTENLLDHMAWLGDQEVLEGEDWADDIIKISNIIEDRRENDALIARLRRALEQIAWETVDDEPPFREMDQWQMSVVARRALAEDQS